MLHALRQKLEKIISQCVQSQHPSLDSCPPVVLEVPNDPKHGDWASTIALQLAKPLRENPMTLAARLLPVIQKEVTGGPLQSEISDIQVKKPGFINFFISDQGHYHALETILKEKKDYGRMNLGSGLKVQIEFVSANPTGPLSVAHARQAAVGDALAHILNFLGFVVTKEYYVNDEGRQIDLLGKSLQVRAFKILGEERPFPEDGYQGEYMRDLAQEFLKARGIKDNKQLERVPLNDLSQFAVKALLTIIQKELKDFGVHFDDWMYQSQVASQKKIERQLQSLKTKQSLYEHEGALWFQSTAFGDDKDRVVKKSDGSYTYLAPDIVYHKEKFERGFKKLINIWGPDHHGYIPRIKAVVTALGYNPDDLEVLIVQLATIYRKGKPVSMSTRKGQYISLREVMDEVGVDAARFFFLMRHIGMPLEFDLDLAKKQTPENPVYYVQYAHARICSLEANALKEAVAPKLKGFHRLKEKEELALIRQLGSFPDILILCYQPRDPFPLVTYLKELATGFHKFYDTHRILNVESELAQERLALCLGVRIVLASGLKLLGLSTPQKM